MKKTVMILFLVMFFAIRGYSFITPLVSNTYFLPFFLYESGKELADEWRKHEKEKIKQRNNRPVKKDYWYWASYYDNACKNGDPMACYKLAILYQKSKKLPKPKKKILIKLYKKACDGGIQNACKKFSKFSLSDRVFAKIICDKCSDSFNKLWFIPLLVIYLFSHFASGLHLISHYFENEYFDCMPFWHKFFYGIYILYLYTVLVVMSIGVSLMVFSVLVT